MENAVVASYENYKEEERLTSNHARRIEFVTTSRVLEEYITSEVKVLDCAAGTGIYAFALADKGIDVTATDITPRHVEIMKNIIDKRQYAMQSAVMDATDMSRFEDGTFDVVLNMGPFYHLTSEEMREQCMSESLRVLKPGGLLFTAYIPRFYIGQLLAMSDKTYLEGEFLNQIIETGTMHHDDEKCFWTDNYFATTDEMEKMYLAHGLQVVDHFAQDGMSPMFSDVVDEMSEEEFHQWCDYHYKVCREPSILGQSNHVMIVGKKVEHR